MVYSELVPQFLWHLTSNILTKLFRFKFFFKVLGFTFSDLCVTSILIRHLPPKLSFRVEALVYFLVSPAYSAKSML